MMQERKTVPLPVRTVRPQNPQQKPGTDAEGRKERRLIFQLAVWRPHNSANFSRRRRLRAARRARLMLSG